MKKITGLKSKALFVFALLALAGSAFASVKAYQSSVAPKTVIVQGNYIEAPLPVQEVSENNPTLGANSGPDLPNPYCQAGECTWTISGTFQDATTTIVSFQDPFRQVTSTGGVLLEFLGGVGWTGASTTYDLVRLYQTGAATSSYGVACGPATGPTGAPVVATTIVTTTAVGGTTQIATSSLGVLENNMTGAQGNRVNGGTVAKVMGGPATPYFTCFVDMNPDGLASITNADNTFAGKYVVRAKRSIRPNP